MRIPAEVLRKVKLLEIRTRKIVNNLFAGEYQTRFRGQGMTFTDFREYVPGDDVRTISWALTARTGKTYIKQFEEEREQTLMLVVDISGSTDFGSGDQFKGEVIAWLAALLAFAAADSKDQIGLLLYTDQVEHYVPPKKGRGHVQRLLRDLLYHKPRSSRTKLAVALQHLQGLLRKKATVFVFSDFMDHGYEKPLRQLGSKHDVIACVIKDPAEQELPAAGLVEIQDAETGELFTLDTSSSSVRKQYHAWMRAKAETRDKALRQAQAEKIEVSTKGDFTLPLINYFRRRGSR